MADKYLICEGDMDRHVFACLPRAAGYTLLPDKPKPCTIRPPSGNRSAIGDAVRLVRTNPPLVVLALDIDYRGTQDLCLLLETALIQAEVTWAGEDGIYDCQGTSLRLVPVGLKGNPDLTALGVASHAIDDYLILLLLDGRTYAGVVESNGREAPPHDSALAAIRSTVAHLREHGVVVDSSKQILELFRAVIRFPASLAAFADSILRHTPAAVREAVLKPLNDAFPESPARPATST